MIKILERKTIKNFEKGSIRRSLFSNGTVTLFHQFSGMKSAVVNLYFLAGSVNELEREHGLAHMIEHMLFKEKENGSLLREIELRGATVNAYTYKEYVCFELGCLGSKLEEFLPLFLKLFLNPEFHEKDLRLEKRVVIQEIKEDIDDHETEGLEILFKKNFKRPLGHPIAGTIKNVNSFKIQDLTRYYNKFFTADRMILSIVSGESSTCIDKILQTHMPKRMNKKKDSIRLIPKEKFGHINHFNTYLHRKMENCIVYYSFEGISIDHKTNYDLSILDDLLFEGLTSKFFLLLREKLGLIYGLGSSINSFIQNGNYVMVFNTQKKYLKQLDIEVKNLWQFYLKNTFSDSEIQATKLRIMDSFDMSFDDMEERCEFIALEELYFTHAFSSKNLKNKMSLVNSNSIMSLMNKMSRKGMTRLVLGPK